MNNIFFNLSGKIDSQITEVLVILHRAAAALDIPLFVIGAFARDLLLEHCYNIKSARKTSDVDLGFQEAYESSISIMVCDFPELVIKIPTLPGLALLKIISWNERFPERDKDALDLLLIMDNYGETGIEDRLYQEESMLNEEEFDLKYASIRLLGKDMAMLASSETHETVKAILVNETDPDGQNRLANSMLSTKIDYDKQLRSIMQKLAKLKLGFVSEH